MDIFAEGSIEIDNALEKINQHSSVSEETKIVSNLLVNVINLVRQADNKSLADYLIDNEKRLKKIADGIIQTAEATGKLTDVVSGIGGKTDEIVKQVLEL